MTFLPDLSLPQRSGLPDEIAYLRDAHPQAGWRRHANFGQLSAFWLHVHHGLRRESADLTEIVGAYRERGGEPAAFPQAFVPRLNHFLQHLHAHHTIEDTAYFPKFRMLDPRMVRGFDLLEADHGLIDTTLHAAVDKARGLLTALAQGGEGDRRAAADAYGGVQSRLFALLDRHLADEEDLVIPAMLQHGERALA